MMYLERILRYRHLFCKPVENRESYHDVYLVKEEATALHSAQAPVVEVDYSDAFSIAEGIKVYT